MRIGRMANHDKSLDWFNWIGLKVKRNPKVNIIVTAKVIATL